MIRFQLKFYAVAPGIEIESEVKMRMGMNTVRRRMYDRPFNPGDIVQFVSCMRPSCVQTTSQQCFSSRGGMDGERARESVPSTC